MRVLFLGRADQFDGRSSITNVAGNLIGLMLKQDPDLHVTWTIPRNTPDDLLSEHFVAPLGEAGRRLDFAKVEATFGGRLLGYFLSEPMYHLLAQAKTRQPYDVILCNQPALMPMYRTLLRNKYQASRYNVNTPIVGWQLWIATQQLLEDVPEYVGGELDVLAESMGSIAAEYNVWESQFMYDDHLKTVRKWLSPHAIRAIRESSTLVNEGVDVRGSDVIRKARAERMALGGKPNLFWGARLANQKQPRKTFPLMREVVGRMEGQIEAIVSTSTQEGGSQGQWAKENFSDLRISFEQNRTQFLRNMTQGDVFLCNSLNETYGLAWLEMLSGGLLGVYEDKWWVPASLPPEYPFVATSTKEQVEMAVALLRDWPDGPLWRKYVPLVKEWLEENHDEVVQATRFLKVLHDAHAAGLEQDEALARSSVGDVVAEAAESLWDGTPIPEEAVYARMNDLSEAAREWGKPGDMITRMYLRRCLQVRGWQDTSQSSRVEFVRGPQ
jgi:hypothetical protein